MEDFRRIDRPTKLPVATFDYLDNPTSLSDAVHRTVGAADAISRLTVPSLKLKVQLALANQLLAYIETHIERLVIDS